MMNDALPRDVRLQFALRALYEKYGYGLYRMGKFEPYDMYRENKNFLRGENIITFTNPNGILMALKPDVTLSIVKHTKPETKTQKLFYHENVFRREKNNREYGEIWQMGLEFIGGGNGYAEAEARRGRNSKTCASASSLFSRASPRSTLPSPRSSRR